MKSFSVGAALIFAWKTLIREWKASLQVVGLGLLYLASQLVVLALPVYVLYKERFAPHYEELVRMNWLQETSMIKFLMQKINLDAARDWQLILMLVGFYIVFNITRAFVYILFARVGLLAYHNEPISISYIITTISPKLVLKGFLVFVILNVLGLMPQFIFALYTGPIDFLPAFAWLQMPLVKYALLALAIAMLYVFIRSILAIIFIADYESSALQALHESYQMTSGFAWMQLIVLLVGLEFLFGFISWPLYQYPFGWMISLVFPYIYILALVHAYKQLQR